MRKRRGILLAALAMAVVGGLVWEVLRSIEPDYEGRTLSLWLEQYSTNFLDAPTSSRTNGASLEAADAIRQMGSRALPALLRMAATKDPPAYKRKIITLLHAQRFFPPPMHTIEGYHGMAVSGFYILGPTAKSSVPTLIDLLSSKDSNVRLTAAWSLGFIGSGATAAVPALIHRLDDVDELVRVRATLALGKIQMQPKLVVPVLIKNLGVSNAGERDLSRTAATIFVLGQFGGEAKSAIPALLLFLNDDSWRIRDLTTNALQQIDPEAAAKIFEKVP